ncbi:TPA: hypothetical protein DCZ50_03105 [Candidatus Nomurabacteria bacterium]|nr:hypothetical protein [Candidatus Nomurabacteria bacterium]
MYNPTKKFFNRGVSVETYFSRDFMEGLREYLDFYYRRTIWGRLDEAKMCFDAKYLLGIMMAGLILFLGMFYFEMPLSAGVFLGVIISRVRIDRSARFRRLDEEAERLLQHEIFSNLNFYCSIDDATLREFENLIKSISNLDEIKGACYQEGVREGIAALIKSAIEKCPKLEESSFLVDLRGECGR